VYPAAAARPANFKRIYPRSAIFYPAGEKPHVLFLQCNSFPRTVKLFQLHYSTGAAMMDVLHEGQKLGTLHAYVTGLVNQELLM
jgi:hypothetical protein